MNPRTNLLEMSSRTNTHSYGQKLNLSQSVSQKVYLQEHMLCIGCIKERYVYSIVLSIILRQGWAGTKAGPAGEVGLHQQVMRIPIISIFISPSNIIKAIAPFYSASQNENVNIFAYIILKIFTIIDYCYLHFINVKLRLSSRIKEFAGGHVARKWCSYQTQVHALSQQPPFPEAYAGHRSF